MLDYNFDEEEDSSKPIRDNIEILFETNNNLQNDVQIVQQREENRHLHRT